MSKIKIKQNILAFFFFVLAVVFSGVDFLYLQSPLLFLFGAPFCAILSILFTNNKFYYLTPVFCAASCLLLGFELPFCIAAFLYLAISIDVTSIMVVKNYSHKMTILTVTALLSTFLLGILAYLYAQSGTSNMFTLPEFISSGIDQIFTAAKQIAGEIYQDQASREQFLEMLPEYAIAVKTVFPSLLVGSGMLVAFITFLFANTVFNRLNRGISSAKNRFWINYKISKTGACVFAGAALLSLFASDDLFQAVCVNITSIFMFCFFISGVAFLCRICKFSKVVGRPFVSYIIIAILSFISMQILPLALFGVVDSVFIKRIQK